MLGPEAAASAPSETLVYSLITDVEKIKSLEECTEAICLELNDKLMQEELENNSKYVLSVKTQTCMYRDSFSNRCCSQNSSVNIENNRTVKLPLPNIIWSVLRIIAVIPLLVSLSRKPFGML